MYYGYQTLNSRRCKSMIMMMMKFVEVKGDQRSNNYGNLCAMITKLSRNNPRFKFVIMTKVIRGHNKVGPIVK